MTLLYYVTIIPKAQVAERHAGFLVSTVLIVVQVLRKYMIVEYLDPWGSACPKP